MSKEVTRLARLGQKILNAPHVIHPGKAEIVLSVLTERLGITRIEQMHQGDVGLYLPTMYGTDNRALLRAPSMAEKQSGTYETAGYDVACGIAKIEIEGTLVAKNYALRPESGMTGYDGIRENFYNAMMDDGVRAIVLEIDSPGGEVAGCFDLVDMMFAAKGIKPVWAILNECAFSGAYAIASIADRITVPRTGGTGSIGVVWAHYDFSQAIEAAGIKVTFVQRGARKVDGAPEIPLSGEALERIQAEIDTLGVLFESTVARNRAGRGLSTASIRDMNAATFLGGEGVTLGLADEVAAPADAYAALLKKLGD